MKRINLSNKRKRILLIISATTLSSLLTVITPLIVLIDTTTIAIKEEIDIGTYLANLEIGTTSLIIIGSLITLFIMMSYFYKALTIKKLIFSLIPETLYLLYIFLSSNLQNYYFNNKYIRLEIDFSSIYLVLLGVPILVITWTLYNFIINRDELKIKLTILRAIQKSDQKNTKKQIKKYILHNFSGKAQLRDKLMQNFNIYFSQLEKNKNPYIKRRNRYFLTSRGNKLVKDYTNEQNFNLLISKYIEVTTSNKKVPMWTEKDLTKLSQNNK